MGLTSIQLDPRRKAKLREFTVLRIKQDVMHYRVHVPQILYTLALKNPEKSILGPKYILIGYMDLEGIAFGDFGNR